MSNASRIVRLMFIYTVLLGVGFAVAFGIGWLVGLVVPCAKLPVFLALSTWWAQTGWRYQRARNRAGLY